MADLNDILEPLFEGGQNLSMTQRGIYVTAGLGLAAAAAQPRPNPLLNVLALAGGAYLALSGYFGRSPVKAAVLDNRSDLGVVAHAGHRSGESSSMRAYELSA